VSIGRCKVRAASTAPIVRGTIMEILRGAAEHAAANQAPIFAPIVDRRAHVMGFYVQFGIPLQLSGHLESTDRTSSAT
jgi:hypothetical protein